MAKELTVRINYPGNQYHGATGTVWGMTVPAKGMRSAFIIHDTTVNKKHFVDPAYVIVLT